jgi:hypothetical protein
MTWSTDYTVYIPGECCPLQKEVVNKAYDYDLSNINRLDLVIISIGLCSLDGRACCEC